MPKVTEYPIIDTGENTKVLGVNEGEVVQVNANSLGGGEQWEVIYENSNGAITGEYTKILDIDAREIIRVTRASQGEDAVSGGWYPSVTSLEMLTLTPNLNYETFIIRQGDGEPKFTYIGYIQYSDMNFSFFGSPLIDKLIYKIERLVK